MFSQSAKYAIKAALFLSVYSDENKKFSFKEIAKEIDAPAAFTAKVLQELGKKNFVSSTKGKHGGFFLTDSQKNNSLFELINEIEGREKLSLCVLDNAHCHAQNPCALHALIYPKQHEMLAGLKEKKLLNFAEEIRSGQSFL